MNDTTTYKTSITTTLKDELKTSAIIFVVTVPLCYFFIDRLPLKIILLIVLFCSSIPTLLALVRYSLFHASSVSLSSQQIVLKKRNGRLQSFDWNDFELVWLGSSSWIFKTNDGNKMTLNKIGFSQEDWFDISEKIAEYRPVRQTQEAPSVHSTSQYQTIIFKPQYEVKLILALVGGGTIILIGWISAATDFKSFYQNELEVLVALLVMTSGILMIPFLLAKRVYLGDKIEVERYFLPKKIIEYRNLTDISAFAIHSTQGRIRINSMKNAHVLVNAIEKKMEEGRIHEHQFEGKEYRKELIGAKALFFSVPITIILIVVLPALDFNILLKYPIFSFLAIFTVVYFAIYFIMKRRASV